MTLRNKEIRRGYGEVDIAKEVKKARLGWYRHVNDVIRRDEGEHIGNIIESEKGRNRGRVKQNRK